MKYPIAFASTVARTTAKSHYPRFAVRCLPISVVAVVQNDGGVSVVSRKAPAIPASIVETVSTKAVTAANDTNVSPPRNSTRRMEQQETLPLINPAMRLGLHVLVVPLFLLTMMLAGPTADAADPDLQLWFPTQIVHPIGTDWAISMKTEVRLQDDISEFSRLVYKPALNYHFSPSWTFSTGYRYMDKANQANEQSPWQEIIFHKNFDDLVTGYQVRLEERFIDDINGALPRLRFLTYLSHPLGDSLNYLTGFGDFRLNLDEKGEGPVSGFEQGRVSAGLGRHIGEHIQFEVSYLWRYEEKRSGADLNQHAIHLQLVLNTKAKQVKKPTSRDQYR